MERNVARASKQAFRSAVKLGKRNRLSGNTATLAGCFYQQLLNRRMVTENKQVCCNSQIVALVGFLPFDF
jgi:hypothetical protein